MLVQFANFNKFLFSEKAHFHLTRHEYKNLNGIISSYFVKDTGGISISVSFTEYLTMLIEFLLPKVLQGFEGSKLE